MLGPIHSQLRVSGRVLGPAALCGREGRLVPRRTVALPQVYRDELAPANRSSGSFLQRTRHDRAVDREGQERGEMDTARLTISTK